jgi:hypothetical protein
MRISVQVEGVEATRARLRGQQKQVRFATMVALNQAAYGASRATSTELARVFDRPTPWVLRSVRYVKATRENLTAQVDFDAWGNKQGVTVAQILRAEITGGVRRNKRHEIALQRAGILPAGMAIVPGPGAKLDAYGNMSAGQITQILSWFQAFGEQGYRANTRDGGRRLGRGNKRTGERGFAYFALTRPRGKLVPGVYQRFGFGALGSSVRPVMFFVAMPKYRPRLDFYGVADRAAQSEFRARFPSALRDALRTAR